MATLNCVATIEQHILLLKIRSPKNVRRRRGVREGGHGGQWRRGRMERKGRRYKQTM